MPLYVFTSSGDTKGRFFRERTATTSNDDSCSFYLSRPLPLPILHIGRSYTYKDSKKGGAITDATFHFFALSVQQQACLLHNSADATRTGHDNDGFTFPRAPDTLRSDYHTPSGWNEAVTRELFHVTGNNLKNKILQKHDKRLFKRGCFALSFGPF